MMRSVPHRDSVLCRHNGILRDYSMELTLSSYLIVCPLVFLASFVDSIAGGGGLISLPAYLLAGIPIHFAIGSNKLSSATGTVISTARMVKNKYADMKLAPLSVAAALAGSFLGARTALNTGAEVLQMLLIIVLPFTAFYVLKNKNLEPENPNSIKRSSQYAIVTAAALIIGFYDGFYGPGAGTFLLLAFTGLAKMDLRTASGNMKLVNLSSNVAAMVTYIAAGKIIWPLSLTAAVFSIAGHYIGSGMVMKNGTKIVKPIILGVLALLFIKVLSGLI